MPDPIDGPGAIPLAQPSDDDSFGAKERGSGYVLLAYPWASVTHRKVRSATRAMNTRDANRMQPRSEADFRGELALAWFVGVKEPRVM